MPPPRLREGFFYLKHKLVLYTNLCYFQRERNLHIPEIINSLKTKYNEKNPVCVCQQKNVYLLLGITLLKPENVKSTNQYRLCSVTGYKTFECHCLAHVLILINFLFKKWFCILRFTFPFYSIFCLSRLC
jgi:hypothetical protein